MVTTIVPSANDVGAVAGDGRVPTEDSNTAQHNAHSPFFSRIRYAANLTLAQFSPGGVISGFDFSSGDATSVVITSGEATIEGYHIVEDSTLAGVLTPSTFNWVFLALTKSGGLVTGIELQVATSGSYLAELFATPGDAILLFVLETNLTVIVDTLDFRTSPGPVMIGQYIGDDAAVRTIDLGFRPKLVKLTKLAADPHLVAWSGVAWPFPSGEQFGLYHFERAPGAGMVTGHSTSPELRPKLEENGFSIEDGPGVVAPGGVLRGVVLAFDPPSIFTDTVFTTAVAVTGALIGDAVLVNFAAAGLASGIILQGNVDVNGSVNVRMKNPGVNVNMGPADLIVTVFPQGGTGANYKLNELGASYYFTAWY